jgi:lipopolysaccharide export LptBFGC system permease protein LptF
MDGHLFPMFLFLSVAAVALFSFVSVATWADARRKEREAYYKSEVLKKIAETQGAPSSAALDYLREEERIAVRRQREGLKLGGLITTAVGIGLMVFFGAVVDRNEKGVMFIGAIPLLIGIALMAYAYLLGPKE